MKLTKNLSREEFACPCCGFDTIDFELVVALQDVVDHFQELFPMFDVGIHINSGNRCHAYNSITPGASNTSKHVQFRAADFFLYDKKTGNYKTGTRIFEGDVASYLEGKYTDTYGIGRYKGRTHLDTRTEKARWDNS
jgi:uncharacterized protein YcbK (DUF882 family)